MISQKSKVGSPLRGQVRAISADLGVVSAATRRPHFCHVATLAYIIRVLFLRKGETVRRGEKGTGDLWDYHEVRSSEHDRETEDEQLLGRDWSGSLVLLIKAGGSESNAAWRSLIDATGPPRDDKVMKAAANPPVIICAWLARSRSLISGGFMQLGNDWEIDHIANRLHRSDRFLYSSNILRRYFCTPKAAKLSSIVRYLASDAQNHRHLSTNNFMSSRKI